MSINYSLYLGPLDGLAMSFDCELECGDEIDVPVDLHYSVPANESSLESNTVLSCPSNWVAVYEFNGVELVYLKTTVTQNV